MSWRVIQRSRITGVEQELAEVLEKEEAEKVLQTFWRSYVDLHYNHYVELRIEEIDYGEEAAEKV